MITVADELIQQLDDELKLGLTRNLIRTGFAVGIEPPTDAAKTGVDKNDRIIYGVAVATEGPAIGHGVDLDALFLEQVVAAGNQAKQGIKARFDHPNASSTSMGKTIGRFKSFRKSGGIVRADLHLLRSAEKAPEGNYPDYLMELAVEDPQSFGTSVVYSGTAEQRLNADGTAQTGEDGKPLNKIARLEKLFAADVVDEPAANPNGLFHSLSQEQLAGKLTSFLDRYFAHKGLSVEPHPAPRKEHDMQPANDSTSPTTQPAPSGSTDSAALKQAIKTRLQAVAKYGHTLGLSHDRIEKFQDSEAPLETIMMEMIEDAEARQFFNQKTLLQAIETQANPSAGGPTDPGSTPNPAPKANPLTEEEQWRAEFDGSAALQAEFMEFDIYRAFKGHEVQSKRLVGADESV